MPLILLFLLFTVLPITEFSLLWSLADAVGIGPTVLLVLGTGVLGAWLARQQGIATLMRVQSEMRQNQMPADALFDGALILVAGAVLITPGMITDAFGFALLTPPIRALVKRGLRRWAARNVRVQTTTFTPGATPRPGSDSVIDAEATGTRVEDL